MSSTSVATAVHSAPAQKKNICRPLGTHSAHSLVVVSETSGSVSKTVEFKVNDGDVDSNLATKGISITASSSPPVVTTSAGDTPYTENDPATTIDNALTVTDPDDANLEGGQVRISNNFESGDTLVFADQNGISDVYNTGTGVLTLSGTSSVANYQTALRSIKFQTDSNNPATSKTVEFKVNDGDVDSNLATKVLTITPVNDAPVVMTSADTTSWFGAPVVIDNALTVTDDETNLEGGQVRISSNFESGDTLIFTTQNDINGVYNSGTGVLTLTGTSSVANYQTALRSIQFDSTGGFNASRVVEFKVNDGNVDSNAATKNLSLN